MRKLRNELRHFPFLGLDRALPSLVLALLLACAKPLPALASDPPDESGLNAAVSAMLPAYWSVESVEIVSSENQGDEVSPRFRQRFVANARPDEDLFLPVPGDGRIGPFAVLITTSPASQVRKLYGTATSVVELGELSTRIELENTVLGVGLPRSLYAGPVVVAGAAHTDEVVDQFLDLHVLSKTVAESVARSAANADALEELAAEERAALESLNRNRLSALRESHEQEIQLIAAAADRERKEIVAENQARMAALKAELQAESEAIERKKDALGQERQLLVDDSRRLMDELAEKVRSDNAAFAEFAERQFERQAAENQARIEALRAELAAEEERIDELAAGLARERQLLIEANQAKLVELEARYQQRREEISAAQETLDAIADAEAEAQAQARLGAALQALAEERARVSDILETIDAADVARRTARRESVTSALSVDDAAQRAAAFSSLLAGDDEELRNIAIEVVLKSGVAELKGMAVEEALRSGNGQLQEMALSERINEASRIVLTFLSDDNQVTATHWLDHAPFADRKSGPFEGEYNPNWAQGVRNPSSRNRLEGGELQITGTWENSYGKYFCTSLARPDRDGVIIGTARCQGRDYNFTSRVRIDL
ncbi:MAG: hypothetical protein F4103_04260 [Boseongicola sp. SB0673_bin_14]|nr:hypothetical protein [Boseongicola sp. SB0667_bin_21]MYI67991.1 hypothetical protein [Boseongicola sp. SB0673_bin_14]